MTSYAMSLDGLSGSEGLASSNVSSVSHGLKVFGPDAGTIAAKVIPFQSLWRSSNEISMREEGATSIAELAVAVLVEMANPNSTTVSSARINMAPEENEGISSVRLSRHRATSGVMRQADPTALPLSILS